MVRFSLEPTCGTAASRGRVRPSHRRTRRTPRLRASTPYSCTTIPRRTATMIAQLRAGIAGAVPQVRRARPARRHLTARLCLADRARDGVGAPVGVAAVARRRRRRAAGRAAARCGCAAPGWTPPPGRYAACVAASGWCPAESRRDIDKDVPRTFGLGGMNLRELEPHLRRVLAARAVADPRDGVLPGDGLRRGRGAPARSSPSRSRRRPPTRSARSRGSASWSTARSPAATRRAWRGWRRTSRRCASCCSGGGPPSSPTSTSSAARSSASPRRSFSRDSSSSRCPSRSRRWTCSPPDASRRSSSYWPCASTPRRR